MDYTKKKVIDGMLQHHGILGMRWGKKNGPPYPLERSGNWSSKEKSEAKGKTKRKIAAKINSTPIFKLYWNGWNRDANKQLEKSAQEESVEPIKQKQKTNQSSSESKAETKPMTISDLSDQELSRIINRMRLEKQYYDLINPATQPSNVKQNQSVSDSITSGTKYVADLSNNIGTIARNAAPVLDAAMKGIGLVNSARDMSRKKTKGDLEVAMKNLDYKDRKSESAVKQMGFENEAIAKATERIGLRLQNDNARNKTGWFYNPTTNTEKSLASIGKEIFTEFGRDNAIELATNDKITSDLARVGKEIVSEMFK